jgi:hypothetical protein
MSIKTTLKTALNLFNDGFVISKANPGAIYNVTTRETQNPPKDVFEVLQFIEDLQARFFRAKEGMKFFKKQKNN